MTSTRPRRSRPTRRRSGLTRRSCALNARPRVVVYVTREHPETGADELLVFDLPDEPEYVRVVPGGRLEPGETAADAAVRELCEETGLEVRVVRELGVLEQPSWRVPGMLDRNHFLHAVPTGERGGEWAHGRFRCRWIPLLAGTEVYGEHGAFLASVLRRRVVAYVTRGRELLVFDHAGMPDVPTQVPAGRIDFDETLEDGVRREVAEETGVVTEVVGELAGPEELARLFGLGIHESHAFHAVAEPSGPAAWEHIVRGSGADAGLTFACRWVRLEDCPPLWGRRDPLVERLSQSIRGS